MISVKWYVNKFLLDERRGGGVDFYLCSGKRMTILLDEGSSSLSLIKYMKGFRNMFHILELRNL